MKLNCEASTTCWNLVYCACIIIYILDVFHTYYAQNYADTIGTSLTTV